MKEPIPFFLITGFLGSGKTTLLKNFIKVYSSKKRLLVVQNEFGDISIDGIELKRMNQKFELMEVNKGSVFCVCLLSDFRSSLKEAISRIQPEAVILEATGLADPIAIAQIIEADDLRKVIFLNYVWCIIDAVNFLKIEAVNTRVAHQVRIADELVINKIDIANEPQIEEIIKKLKDINPFAKISKTFYANLTFNTIFEKTYEPIAIKRKEELSSLSPGKRPEISTLTLRLPDAIQKERIIEFLKEYSKTCYRIKGYVKLKEGGALAIQCVAGDCYFEELKNYNAPTEIIFLGEEFERNKLKNLFIKKCLS